MRALLILVFGVAAAAFGHYWLNPTLPICHLPVRYAIGEFDERFGISRAQAEAALTAAENIWEEALGRDDVFVYDDNARLSVNFIYDERQRQADAAMRALDDISIRGDANEVLVELHRRLVDEYASREARYEALRTGYETRLAAYNAEVERYNGSGGAPPEVYAELEERRRELDRDRVEINDLGSAMNDLVDQINSIGEKGNELIREYNERIRRFNDTYVQDHEYTQGDYRHREINVYTFGSEQELILVLAHELGHALSIDHVDDPSSIMYYLMGEQPTPPTLSAKDKAAFAAACEAGAAGRLLGLFRSLYNGLVNN